MKILFLDESGDHSLDVIDPQYPLFVLGGYIMDLHYHESVATPLLNAYKHRLFGTSDFILHTAEIVRRKGPFQKLTDHTFRDKFYSETNAFMRELDYKVVACAIRKDEHLDQYGLVAMDPYLLSLRVLVERFAFEIGSVSGGGQIVAEARDETLDNELRLAWIDIRTAGTEYLSASDIRTRITELHVRDKAKNIAGLQVADLIVSPIGRFILGKNPRQDWQIIRSKFRSAKDGRYEGYGLVTLPKKKKAAPE
ncbi:MAG: DUF3800 domain-containing protein [Nitrospiraceae bacterium]